MLKRLNDAPESEKPTLRTALKLGLEAFGSEVAFDED